MNPALWAVSQVMSYPLVWWCVFVTITTANAYFWRSPGILVGQITVAAIIVWLDIEWIQAAMVAPGWHGSPDMDFVFQIGVLLRIVLVNTVLLPIGVATVAFTSRRRLVEIFSEPSSNGLS